MTYTFDEEARARARTAYETLEPFHVVAYFAPRIADAQSDLGLDAHAWYVGARAAPMGPCAPAVVSAAFYNFNPNVVEPGWRAACEAGLSAVHDRRNHVVADTLGDLLGDLATDDATTRLAERYQRIAEGLPLGGRPLAAAWAAAPVPSSSPVVALWHAIAILREWRGDGHVAALTTAGLDRLEAVVFHEATHPDPAVRKRGLGKKLAQLTRNWSDDEWDAATASLTARGLLERVDGRERLTDSGGHLYDTLEAITDDAAAAAWAGVDDFDDLMSASRPYVTPVVDAGILPGTRPRS